MPASDIVPFDFESHPVRITDRDGEPWFVLADVCSVLEHSNPSVAGRRLDADEKGVASVYTPGGDQEVTVINESGLYSLILTSRKPAAKRFKKWVTSEVLPTIRKTGGYAHAPAEFSIPANYGEALQLAADQQRLLDRQTVQILALTPKALALEQIAGITGSLNLRESAKLLGRREREFISELQARKIIYRRPGQTAWLGYADKEQAGLVEHKHATIERRDGSERSVAQVRLTTKLLTRLAEQQAGGSAELFQ